MHTGLEARHPAGEGEAATANVAQPRAVWVIADVSNTPAGISSVTGKHIFDLHASLHVDGTNTDGPLRIEIVVDETATFSQTYIIRVKDLGVANTGRPIGPWASIDNAHRQVVRVGETSLTNSGIFDHDTGRGIVVDAWKKDPMYSVGGGVKSNTCLDLVRRILVELNLELGDFMKWVFAGADEVYTVLVDRFVERMPYIWSERIELPRGVTLAPDVDAWSRLYDVLSEPDRSIRFADSIPEACTKKRMSKRACIRPMRIADMEVLSDALKPGQAGDQRLATIDEESRPAAAPFQDTVARPGAAGTVSAAVGMGRISGVLSTMLLVGGEVVKVAGAAAGPLIVLLDLVNGEWLGAGLAVVGLGLGIAATLAVAGPVGWIFGAAIAALFAILPGIFKRKKVPKIGDRQAILQFAYFGDPEHSGNEQCAAQGNPNCTAVFGPGVLSSVFGWNNFDSVVFLIHFNEGYAMTLPEIANSFYNVDDPNNRGSDSSNQIATLRCNNKKGTANAFGGWEGDDPGRCNRPTFQLNRNAITLNAMNETADKTYGRIIPNADGKGDCKLISDAANTVNIPEYNLTLTGQPVAIACNLSASEVIDGTVIPLDPHSNPVAVNVSSGTTSTDGQNGHQISVPAPTPFEPLLNSTNAVCLSGSGASLCVPAGRYDIQRGSLGFDTSKADTLTMPAGASISWTKSGVVSGLPPRLTMSNQIVSFSANLTAEDKGFAQAMAAAPRSGPDGTGAIWNASLPNVVSDPPVVCLFTETMRNGDVACFGPGGGNVTEGISGKAESMAVHGGATAQIFAQFYGDAGSVSVTEDVLDLSQLIYGAEGNFEDKIVAMRVCRGSCGVS